jgi:hypothetical protein
VTARERAHATVILAVLVAAVLLVVLVGQKTEFLQSA